MSMILSFIGILHLKQQSNDDDFYDDFHDDLWWWLLACKVEYIARQNNKIVFFVNKNNVKAAGNLICYKTKQYSSVPL